MNRIVGLDVGGANLKYASADAKVFRRRFPMWRTPHALAEAIEQDLRREYGPVATLAVTMTGELADCFADRGVGVAHIVEHVMRAADRTGVGLVRFYGVDGTFYDRDDAVAFPDRVAAANWHALASEVACQYPDATLMIDVGSTTTDIVPLDNGSVATEAETDHQRLVEGSLVYVGCRRTPVCALVDRATVRGQESPLMNEVFATVDDARLVLGLRPPDPDDVDSADGQPRTRQAAANRLARMVGLDHRTLGMVDVEPLARQVIAAVTDAIGRGIRGVDRGSEGPWVLSGHGQDMVDVPAGQPVIDLAAEWGRDVSRCAPSFAVARRWLATCCSEGGVPALVSDATHASKGTRTTRRVVKLGGSLLTRPGLVEDVRAWFAAAPAATDLVLVGGGELIDGIRTLDALRPGEPAETHWLCIELLDVTFRLARQWFPEWDTIGADESFDPGHPIAAEREGSGGPVRPTLVSVGSFYRRGSGGELPESWETTTDAIAGWLAVRSGASELVLLKSCEVDPDESLQALADRGVVDRAITRLVDQLPRVRVERLSQFARAR